MSGPLQGVRVIAVEQYGAGPWATMQLSDLGAEVIKIEDPRVDGDVGRYVPPYQEAESSLFFEAFNRGKRSVSLDLTNDAGRRVFEGLLKVSDALFSNVRGDVPARLGLRYEDVAQINPALVCCALTGYGQTGPRAAQGAYDYVIQAQAGWMSLTGEPDGPPTRSGLSLVDFCGGYVAALAIVAGLHQAQTTGVGLDADVSLFEAALSLLNYQATWTASRGYEAQRLAQAAHPSIVPFQNFRAADGWLSIACPKPSLWQRLCTALGLAHLADDERFAEFADRAAHRDELVAELEAVLGTRTVQEWLDVLEPLSIPCAPINSVAEALADVQTVERGMVASYEHPELGTVRTPAAPVRIDSVRPAAERAPFRGEHTDAVCRELLGYSEGQIAELREAGAFGSDAE